MVCRRQIQLILLCCYVWISGVTGGITGSSAIHNKEEWIHFPDDYSPYASASSAAKLKKSTASVSHPPVPSTSWRSSATEIFVGIVHYRDSRCGMTLKNLFSKAKYPGRIRVGVVKQKHTEDDVVECINNYCRLSTTIPGTSCPYKDQIQSIEDSFLDARGPAFARHMTQFMMNDEEFCMQVDSHSDFIQNWDVHALTMWGSIQNEYAVLSTMPPDVTTLGKNINDHWEVPHVCAATINDNNMVRNLQPRAAMNLDTPILAPFWSGSFSFSKCHAEIKTPFDPNIPYIMDGEEFSKFARLWTRGYDVYTPSRSIVGHDTEETMLAKAPKLTNNDKVVQQKSWMDQGMDEEYMIDAFQMSLRRLYTLLGNKGGDRDAEATASLTQYGLGNRRSLDQLIAFTGIDLRKGVVVADRCKPLQWVPFLPDTNAEISDGDVWGMDGEKRKRGAGVPLQDGTIVIYSSSRGLSEGSVEVGGEDVGSKNNLRANSNEALSSSSSSLSSDSQTLKFVHRAEGELWWIFQHVDSAVEDFIFFVDGKLGEGKGHGYRVMKLLLLVAPIFMVVVSVAMWLVSGGSTDSFVKDI